MGSHSHLLANSSPLVFSTWGKVPLVLAISRAPLAVSSCVPVDLRVRVGVDGVVREFRYRYRGSFDLADDFVPYVGVCHAFAGGGDGVAVVLAREG